MLGDFGCAFPLHFCFFEGGYTGIYNLISVKNKKQESPASRFETTLVKHLEAKSNTKDLIPMPFVICKDDKGNQCRIVLSSMSTQQLMILPGIIPFKRIFHSRAPAEQR